MRAKAVASRRAGTSGGCCGAGGLLLVLKRRTEVRAECLTFSLQIFKLLSGVVTCVFFGFQTNA